MEIRVPALGESLVEATVGRWRKQVGDAVARGDLLVDLETEKINLEVEAEEAGTIQSIARVEGENVQVGELLATLVAGLPRAATAPSARQIAADAGVDLSKVAGSGRGGRVTGEDARALAAALPPPRVEPEKPREKESPRPIDREREPAPRLESGNGASGAGQRRERSELEQRLHLSRRRQTIARRLVEAQQTAAILTTFNEIDMSAVMDLRRRRREAFQERHGVGLGFMSFFTRAVVGALKAFPVVNSELAGDELILKQYYDIGIAVSTDEGLVVPVLRDADRLTFAGIESAIVDMARRARESKLALKELMGGTFTITNGGIFGSLLSTPILNPPQVGILGMHTIQERPVAVKGEVVVRPMMYVALSYDHRVIDGREAVQFLVRIKQLIEDPEVLLIEG